MVKLLILLLAIPIYLRFRFRRSPRVRGRIVPWSAATAAMLLLIASPWNPTPGTPGTVLASARVATALGLLAYLIYDIRRALR